MCVAFVIPFFFFFPVLVVSHRQQGLQAIQAIQKVFGPVSIFLGFKEFYHKPHPKLKALKHNYNSPRECVLQRTESTFLYCIVQHIGEGFWLKLGRCKVM